MEPRALEGGLVLRTAEPRDLEQIGELLVARGEEADARDHRLVVEDPTLGWEACAVVVDGDRVVSTATLLDETVRIGTVTLPAGQVELVATASSHEGRGLVRALMAWAHERSRARGHLLQVMIGIPYFYRLFGYEYAVDIPRARALRAAPSAPATLRRATAADIPALTALQDEAQAPYDVAMPHPPARRHWLLDHDSSTTWILDRDGDTVACGRLGDGLLAEAAARDHAAADRLLAGVAALADGELSVVHRPLTVTGRRWDGLLGEPPTDAQQYYARIERPELVLDALRPVLSARLAASGLERSGADLVLSTFGRHYRLPVGDDGIGPVTVGGPMQAPGVVRGLGVAPDRLPALLLGPHGIDGLERLHPDVYAGPDRELMTALFPPLSADLLTYYLPW